MKYKVSINTVRLGKINDFFLKKHISKMANASNSENVHYGNKITEMSEKRTLDFGTLDKELDIIRTIDKTKIVETLSRFTRKVAEEGMLLTIEDYSEIHTLRKQIAREIMYTLRCGKALNQRKVEVRTKIDNLLNINIDGIVFA